MTRSSSHTYRPEATGTDLPRPERSNIGLIIDPGVQLKERSEDEGWPPYTTRNGKTIPGIELNSIFFDTELGIGSA